MLSDYSTSGRESQLSETRLSFEDQRKTFCLHVTLPCLCDPAEDSLGPWAPETSVIVTSGF